MSRPVIIEYRIFSSALYSFESLMYIALSAPIFTMRSSFGSSLPVFHTDAVPKT